MLLLFWGTTGLLSTGYPNNLSWRHSTGYPPRYLCSAETGLSIINPFHPEGVSPECSYAILDKTCVSSDVYDGNIVIGTASGGLYKVDWDYVIGKGCDINNPYDFSSDIEGFTTFSGLLSNEIIEVEANGDYLGIVTSSGFCYGRAGESEYINYVTESGKDCFVRADNHVYFAEGNRILSKGSPGDFSSWDQEYNLSYEINDIWVASKEGVDTIFVGTEGGPYVIQGANTYDYSTVVSGSKNIVSVAVEYDSNYNWGHLFTAASGMVNIINLKSKEVETIIPYEGLVLFAVESQRLYSK